jgi:hypothetical protein
MRTVVVAIVMVISGCGVRNSALLCPALEVVDVRVQGALTYLAESAENPICDPEHPWGIPDTPLCAAQRQLDAASAELRGQ